MGFYECDDELSASIVGGRFFFSAQVRSRQLHRFGFVNFIAILLRLLLN